MLWDDAGARLQHHPHRVSSHVLDRGGDVAKVHRGARAGLAAIERRVQVAHDRRGVRTARACDVLEG